MKKFVATLAVAAAVLAAAVHAQQVRDTSSQAPRAGNAAISGIVMSADQTPQPIRRAAVTLVNTEGGVVRTTYTNDAGRFSATGLPAGRYTVAASKPPYLRMAYGAKRPDTSGTSIMLANNGQMNDINLRLPRGSVISGRITDENGEPAFGVNVNVMMSRMQNGQRTMVSPGLGLGSDTTDDRGVFRIYGLQPGEYVVTATPRVIAGEIRAMTETEIRAVMQAVQQQQQQKAAAAQQQQQNSVVGYGAPSPTPTPTPAPKPDVEKVTVAYAPVYYPGTTVASTASMVTVGLGEDKGGLDFPLRLVRTAKIEGQVLAPEGVPPQSVQLMMVPAGAITPVNNFASMAAIEQLATQRVMPGPDGKFTYNAVPPGTYQIVARAVKGGPGAPPPPPPPPGAMGAGAASFTRVVAVGGDLAGIDLDNIRLAGGAGDPNAIQYWGQVEVPIDGTPVSGVTIPMQPGMTVTGRVEFRSTMTRPGADFKSVTLNLQVVNTGGGPRLSLGAPGFKIDESGQFTITGVVPGRYRITGRVAPGQGPSTGPPWLVGSAMAKGRDALDFPLEVGPGEDVGGVVVTFTDAMSEISGSLQDGSGRPAPDYTIIVYPADRALWSAARRIVIARPATDGKFMLRNLAAGEYMMAAVTDLAPNEQNDQAFLEQILPASFKITVAAGEKKVQDLKISGGL